MHIWNRNYICTNLNRSMGFPGMQSCLTLCDPMHCCTPGLPGHHQLLEIGQTHAHQVGDSIQPSHPLPSSSLLPSGLPNIRIFPSESVLHIWWPKFGVSASASVLPMDIQGWFPVGWTGWISLQSKGLSRVFSNMPVQIQLLDPNKLWPNFMIPKVSFTLLVLDF